MVLILPATEECLHHQQHNLLCRRGVVQRPATTLGHCFNRPFKEAFPFPQVRRCPGAAGGPGKPQKRLHLLGGPERM